MSKVQKFLSKKLAALNKDQNGSAAVAAGSEDATHVDPKVHVAEDPSLPPRRCSVELEALVVAASYTKRVFIAEVLGTGELIKLEGAPVRDSSSCAPSLDLLTEILITEIVEIPPKSKKEFPYKWVAISYSFLTAGLTPRRGVFYKRESGTGEVFSRLLGLSTELMADEFTEGQGYYEGWYYELPNQWGLKVAGKRLLVARKAISVQRFYVCAIAKLGNEELEGMLKTAPNDVDEAKFLVRDPNLCASQLQAVTAIARSIELEPMPGRACKGEADTVDITVQEKAYNEYKAARLVSESKVMELEAFDLVIPAVVRDCKYSDGEVVMRCRLQIGYSWDMPEEFPCRLAAREGGNVMSRCIVQGFDMLYRNEHLSAYFDPAQSIASTTKECDELFAAPGVKLDVAQEAAVRKALDTPMSTIQAPAGAGKTTLLKAYIRQRLTEDPGRRIAVVCQSNRGTRQLIDSLLGADLCPEGPAKNAAASAILQDPINLHGSLLEKGLSPDFLTQFECEEAKELLKACHRYWAQHETVRQTKPTLGTSKVGRKGMEMDRLATVLRKGVFSLCDWPILGATVNTMCSTNYPATDLIVDDAELLSQDALLALLCHVSSSVQKVVLLGDVRQQGPIAPDLPKGELITRLIKTGELTRLSARGIPVSRLDITYRSHPQLVSLLFSPIYGSIRAGASSESRNLAKDKKLDTADDGTPCLFVHNTSTMNREGVNEGELAFLANCLHYLKNRKVPASDVLVLCYHHTQLAAVNALRTSDFPFSSSTVTACQGLEAKCVIVLTSKGGDDVRSNSPTLSFVSCPRRSCVALTRGSEYVIVVGCWDKLFRTDFWRRYRRGVADAGALVDTNLVKPRQRPSWL